jgi:hydroxypyruvate isomerase
MLRLCANLTMLFTEFPFLERFAQASKAGFSAVEFLFPYPYSVGDLKSQLDANSLTLVLHNLPAGDFESGERGIACIPGREEEFQTGVFKAIEYAQALGVKQLNCLAGIAPVGVESAIVETTFIMNLKFAATQLEKAGLRLLIEPINQFDIPGFYLNRTTQAIEVIEQVNASNLYLQYDIYHAQRTEGELANTLEKHIGKIGHIQLADNPGRHEPGTGEINYQYLFAHLDRIGYGGWIGCEYKPAINTLAGLPWMEPYLSSQSLLRL